MRTAQTLLLTLAILAPAAPVFAKDEAPKPPEPWVAAAASGLAFPVTALTLGAIMGTLSGNPMAAPVNVAWALTPLLTGAGQFYSGDRTRALWVGLGGPVAVVGGGVLGAAIALPLSAALNPKDTQAALGGFIIGGLIAGAIYPIWASVDAYHTAQRAAAVPQAAKP